jgi:hypothetical protein
MATETQPPQDRPLAAGHRAQRLASSRRKHRRGMLAEVADYTGVLGALLQMIWQHKLWWMVPLVVALLLLAALILLQATPIAPIIYPVF